MVWVTFLRKDAVLHCRWGWVLMRCRPWCRFACESQMNDPRRIWIMRRRTQKSRWIKPEKMIKRLTAKTPRCNIMGDHLSKYSSPIYATRWELRKAADRNSYYIILYSINMTRKWRIFSREWLLWEGKHHHSYKWIFNSSFQAPTTALNVIGISYPSFPHKMTTLNILQFFIPF